MENNELSQEEMNLLLGGIEAIIGWGSLGIGGEGDVNNNNYLAGCLCSYTNTNRVVQNNNKTTDCKCSCI